jgi:hypothetical protein
MGEDEAALVLHACLHDDAAFLGVGDLGRHAQLLLDRDGSEVAKLEARGHGRRDREARHLPARLVEERRDEPAVRDPWCALEALREDVRRLEPPFSERPVEAQPVVDGG